MEGKKAYRMGDGAMVDRNVSMGDTTMSVADVRFLVCVCDNGWQFAVNMQLLHDLGFRWTKL